MRRRLTRARCVDSGRLYSAPPRSLGRQRPRRAVALLEAGADPNVLATASFARVTPLGSCAFSGALGVARLLLEHGADPHIGEDGAYTVEAEAIARGNEELARLIEDAAGRKVAR